MTPLRKVRLQHGLTLKQVAADLKIDPSYLSRVESGIRTPSTDMALVLANYKQWKGELSVLDLLYPGKKFNAEHCCKDKFNKKDKKSA